MVVWTGFQIAALQRAMRMEDNRQFCEHVGISERMYYYWIGDGATRKRRVATRTLFDRVLDELTPEQRRVFELEVGSEAADGEVPCGKDAPEVDVKRNEFLRVLMVGPPALAVAAPTILALWNGDEAERMAFVTSAPNRADAQTPLNIRNALNVARKMDDDEGPSKAIGAVQYIAETTRSLLVDAPNESVRVALRQQLAPIHTSEGWQLFDLKRFPEAIAAYTNARNAADGVQDDAAGAMALAEWGVLESEMAQRAPERTPHIAEVTPASALDKYVAAEARALRAPYDPNLRAHTASLVARGAAKVGDAAGCRAAVARAYGYNAGDVDPQTSLAYFSNHSHVTYQAARAFQLIGDTSAAEEAIVESLRHTSIRAGLTSDRLVTLSAIRLDAGDVDGSADALVRCAEVSRKNSSARLTDKILDRRTALQVRAPHSSVVRGLDEKLTELGIAV